MTDTTIMKIQEIQADFSIYNKYIENSATLLLITQ